MAVISELKTRSKNLVNVSSDKNTYGYLDESGNIVSHGAIKYTDYISTNNETQITFSNMGSNGMSAPATCFYDENKTFISGVAFNGAGEKTINIPENAKYFRTCFRTSYTEFMVEFGSVATGYKPYYVDITRYNNETINGIEHKNDKIAGLPNGSYHFAKKNEVIDGVCINSVNEPIVDMQVSGNSVQSNLPSEYQEYTSITDTNGVVYTRNGSIYPAKRNSDGVFGLYNTNINIFQTEV